MHPQHNSFLHSDETSSLVNVDQVLSTLSEKFAKITQLVTGAVPLMDSFVPYLPPKSAY